MQYIVFIIPLDTVEWEGSDLCEQMTVEVGWWGSLDAGQRGCFVAVGVVTNG